MALNGTEINTKTIAALVFAALVILLLNFYQLKPAGFLNILNPMKADCSMNNTCTKSEMQTGEAIANCKHCIPLKGTKIRTVQGIGEYIDFRLAQKLETLTRLNPNWRVTEAYPPTVRHLSACHENGTCADIGLYPEKRTAESLSVLCKDALKAGLTVTNEYSTKSLLIPSSACPESNVFETTTGGHLHVQE
jgi:hypothetical protein